MSKIGTETEARDALRNLPMPLQSGAVIDEAAFRKGHSRIEHPLTGEVRHLPQDNKGRVRVWNFHEKKFIWRKPVDVLEMLAHAQGSFDEVQAEEEAPKGRK